MAGALFHLEQETWDPKQKKGGVPIILRAGTTHFAVGILLEGVPKMS